MFVDFEGIDGSGKTTLSNAVCDRLRRLGHRVRHAREGGDLATGVARRVRELTRDVRLLEMSPHAELFLNLARDAQQIDEVIAPALGRGEICIADRYLYSHLALSSARGLEHEEVAPAVRLAARGLWPDLVVLTDVEPDLARLRKRVGKILAGRELDGESRKGLAGMGLQARVRERFLEMAREDPSRWVVVRNEGRSLAEITERVLEGVLARLEGRPAAPAAEPRAERREPPVIGRGEMLEALPARLFAELDRLAEREPALAAFLLTGIPGPAAHRRRVRHAGSHPRVVAFSLCGLFDDASHELRRMLADEAPVETALSLDGDGSRAALALRRVLLPRARAAVLRSLRGDDSPEAWDLRARALGGGALAEVLEGLAGIEGDLAWELRDEGMRAELWGAVARSVGGLASARAEEVRERLLHRDPLAVLRGTTGLDTPLAQRLRTELFDRAPKRVLRSLVGVDAPYAWALREGGAPRTKEALDSVDGMDHPAAWDLRERFATLWPATAVSSVERLALTPRGRALIRRVLGAWPQRLTVLRNAYAVASRARAGAFHGPAGLPPTHDSARSTAASAPRAELAEAATAPPS